MSGDAHYVADADRADVIVASTDGGVVAVDTTANGVDIEPLPIMGGFPVFTVRLDDVLIDEPTPLSTRNSYDGQPMPLWRWTVWISSVSVRR